MQKSVVIYLVLTVLLISCGGKQTQPAPEKAAAKRIVSLSGTITEIIFELGAENELVAVDVTSTYPEAAAKRTNLGHVRSVTAEGILGSRPTHVLAFADELQPDVQQQLKKAGVEVVTFERKFTVKSARQVIRDVATWLHKQEQAKTLIAGIDREIKQVKQPKQAPKILFVYARGTGMMMVAGDHTPLSEMITLAGGVNAVTGFEDFKPLTAEAVIAANPDAILLFDSGKASLNDAGGVLSIPGVRATNAGKNKAVITMDGQLLSGFGPRTGKAVRQLNDAFLRINR